MQRLPTSEQSLHSSLVPALKSQSLPTARRIPAKVDYCSRASRLDTEFLMLLWNLIDKLTMQTRLPQVASSDSGLLAWKKSIQRRSTCRHLGRRRAQSGLPAASSQQTPISSITNGVNRTRSSGHGRKAGIALRQPAKVLDMLLSHPALLALDSDLRFQRKGPWCLSTHLRRTACPARCTASPASRSRLLMTSRCGSGPRVGGSAGRRTRPGEQNTASLCSSN